MARWLSRLFNIYPGEWRRILFLCVIIALPNLGIVWGTTISYSVFLKTVGMGALPWIIVISSILSILALAIYSAFVDRVSDGGLLIGIFSFGIVSILAGLYLLAIDLSILAFPILYLLFLAWTAVANPHFVTYINSFYDTQAAKRVLPVVSAAGRAGAIIAGLTVPLIMARLQPALVIVIWLLTYVIALLVVWAMPILMRDKPNKSHKPGMPGAAKEKQAPGFLQSISEGVHYTLQSPYLRWMAFSTLTLMILMAVLEFRSSQILVAQFSSQQAFASYIGLLDGISNLFVLPMLLFGVSRLIARIGLDNMSLVFPGLNLLINIGLIRWPGLASASAAYFDRKALRTSLQLPVDGLLYNAVPLRVKGRSRAFVGGLIVPIGSLIGGLLLFPPFLRLSWFIPVILGLLSVAYMGSAFVIRKNYSQALIKLLEQEDYTFLLNQEASELPTADPATLGTLQKKLESASNHEMRVFMIKLITQIGGNQAINILEPAVRSAEEARTRSAMIDIIAAAGLRSEKIKDLYFHALGDPDSQVRQSAIAALEQSYSADPVFRKRLVQLVEDPDPRIKLRTLAALADFGNLYELPAAVQALEALQKSPDPSLRAQGPLILGEIRQPRAVVRLVEFLADPDDQVRLAAANTTEKLSLEVIPGYKDVTLTNLVLEKTVLTVKDPVERIRQAALIILARLGKDSARQMLINGLTDPSPLVRNTAVDMLAQYGKAIIPVLHPKLESTDPQLRKMAAVALSKINPRQYWPVIVGTSITGNLLTIYRNDEMARSLSPLRSRRSINILASALTDQNRQLADELIYLLSATHDAQAVAVIGEALNSDNPRSRANAVEALEALTTPQTARLIGPVFEPDTSAEVMQALAEETWELKPPDAPETLRQLAAQVEDPWMRALACYALGESNEVLPLFESTALLNSAASEASEEIRQAAAAALLTLEQREQQSPITSQAGKENTMLSIIDRIIFLKEVPFFRDMTIDELKILASVCEEQFFEKDAQIFSEGEPGGVLYVVISGRVGIEQEKRARSFARLADIEAYSYFGEANFFDGSLRSTYAVATQDTQTLTLRVEPLLALARQNPELSLKLINVLSQRLREVNDRLADQTRARPRSLHQLYDQFESN
jgi:HEAT repeat protein/CRP-like cAMP-binding protein